MSVTIHLPAHLQMSSFDVTMLVAVKLFEQGKVSSGQAAEMVNLSKRAFIELLGNYGVSVLGYDTLQDIENDLKNV
jgi:predicted HTH domain antitoxin